MNVLAADSPPGSAPIAVSVDTACLILNPLSFRTSRGGLARAARAMAERSAIRCVEVRTLEQIVAATDDCLARGTRRLMILAGDGTVHAVADHLASQAEGLDLPQLLVLGGGRTNLIAADVSGNGGLLRKLEAALALCRFDDAGREQRRHTLLLEQDGQPTRHGFFVAGAMIDDVIRLIHQAREGGGRHRKGHLNTAWQMARLLWRALVRDGRGLPPVPELVLQTPELGGMHGPTRVLVASTLEHRDGLLNPYAARGEGPLRVTALSGTVRALWRRLLPVLLGRFGRDMDLRHGYLSGRCTVLEVHGLRRYTLDGESFEADPQQPLRIRTGRELRFWVPGA